MNRGNIQNFFKEKRANRKQAMALFSLTSLAAFVIADILKSAYAHEQLIHEEYAKSQQAPQAYLTDPLSVGRGVFTKALEEVDIQILTDDHVNYSMVDHTQNDLPPRMIEQAVDTDTQSAPTREVSTASGTQQDNELPLQEWPSSDFENQVNVYMSGTEESAPELKEWPAYNNESASAAPAADESVSAYVARQSLSEYHNSESDTFWPFTSPATVIGSIGSTAASVVFWNRGEDDPVPATETVTETQMVPTPPTNAPVDLHVLSTPDPVVEGTAVEFNGLVITDADHGFTSGQDDLTVSIYLDQNTEPMGLFSFDQTVLSNEGGDGSSQAQAIEFTGSKMDLEVMLNSMKYQAADDGAYSLIVDVTDNGNEYGDATTDVAVIDFTVDEGIMSDTVVANTADNSLAGADQYAVRIPFSAIFQNDTIDPASVGYIEVSGASAALRLDDLSGDGIDDTIVYNADGDQGKLASGLTDSFDYTVFKADGTQMGIGTVDVNITNSNVDGDADQHDLVDLPGDTILIYNTDELLGSLNEVISDANDPGFNDIIVLDNFANGQTAIMGAYPNGSALDVTLLGFDNTQDAYAALVDEQNNMMTVSHQNGGQIDVLFPETQVSNHDADDLFLV